MSVGIVAPLAAYTLHPAFIAQNLEDLATEPGRDPASLSISVFGQPPETTRSQVDDFLNAGAERVAVWPAPCDMEAAMGEQLERMAKRLLR